MWTTLRTFLGHSCYLTIVGAFHMVWTPLHHIIKVCGPFENGNGSQNSAMRWGHVRLKFDGAETGHINVQLFAHIRIGPCGRFWSWLSQKSKGNLEPDITRIFYCTGKSGQSGNHSRHVWRGHERACGWSFTVAAHLLREMYLFLSNILAVLEKSHTSLEKRS